MNNPKILLGGVPFGCDNIGDEAILKCVVNLIRAQNKHADIRVSTNDQKRTAHLLNVSTCPLYGFDNIESHRGAFISALKWADIFVWAGATGLSDYPESGLNCLEEAHRLGVKTVVFCTGMNDTFNPAHFTLTQGKKYKLLKSLNYLTGNNIDFVKTYENRRLRKLKTRITNTLDDCDLVVNRDKESKLQLENAGVTRPILVGADPAITLELNQPNESIWGNGLTDFLQAHKRVVGVCISSQQALEQMDEFSNWLDRNIIKHDFGVVFIPMNPITDFELMAKIRESMIHKQKTFIATGSDDPSDIAGLAANMDLIISSRLHLLIFASISATPCIGIGRGSKVSNFLKQVGQRTAGSTEDLDLELLELSLNDIFEHGDMYKDASLMARERMLTRLSHACNALKTFLDGVSYPKKSMPTSLVMGE